MVLTWSKHGPDIVLKIRHSVDIGLRPFLLSLENFSALAALEVKLGQTWSLHGPFMALTWYKKVDTKYTWALDLIDSVLKISVL